MFWFVVLVFVTATSGTLHFVPNLEENEGKATEGSVVLIKIMKMEECGEPDETVFCSNRNLTQVRNTAAVICRSIMDVFYTTGDAVTKKMTAKHGNQVELIGYDFDCKGSENNLDQCKARPVVCHHKVTVKCSKPGLSGICKSPCGCMAPTLLPKIIGGQDAFPGEFPWQVTVSVGKYMCGGTIIGAQYILTAAHCFHLPSSKHIPCKAQAGSSGSLDECRWLPNLEVFYDSIEFYSNKNSNAKKALGDKVFIHKDYVRGNTALLHDIAIIRLKEPLELTPYVHPVCLPDHWDTFTLPSNASVTVSGFGDTSRYHGIYPDTLLKASVSWLEIEQCNKVMFGYLSDGHFCAGDVNGNVDACRGDSGGPLVYKNERGIATIVGIVSFSYGCAVKGLWSMYTDVQKEGDFINDVMTNTYDLNTVILSCHLRGGKGCERI